MLHPCPDAAHLFWSQFLFSIRCLALPAPAQVTSTQVSSALTNDVVLAVENGTLSLSSPTNLIVDIPQGKPLGLWIQSTNLAAGASNSTPPITRRRLVSRRVALRKWSRIHSARTTTRVNGVNS